MFRIDPAHTGVANTKAEAMPNGSWIAASPAFYNGTIYAASSAAHSIGAFDARTGAQKWNFEAGSNVFSSPSISDGVAETIFTADCRARLHPKPPNAVWA